MSEETLNQPELVGNIHINYTTNLNEFSNQVDEIIALAEKLRKKMDELGITVTVLKTNS